MESDGRYEDQTFSDLFLEFGYLETAVFVNCTFRDAILTETEFRGCRFVECAFVRCDLSLVKWTHSTFAGVLFEGCKLAGIDWTQLDWQAVRLGEPFRFRQCALNHGTFIGLSLPELMAVDCTAVDVDFREADLTRADFSGSDLRDSLFSRTNLTRADLRRARNYSIDPGQNTLTGARFTLPEALALLYSMDIDLSEGAEPEEGHG